MSISATPAGGRDSSTEQKWKCEENDHAGLRLCNTTGKLKRKDQHPVRKEFIQTSETHYKCVHCEWTTVLNATRMVKHIVEQCQNAPITVREEIAAIQHATIEKERNSPLVAENKKDIHGLFQVLDNKRACMFCQWTTVRNLTRMRNHIVSQCTEVPVKLKALFIKKEDNVGQALVENPTEAVQQDDSDSYQVYAVEDGRWDESGIEPIYYGEEDVVEDPQLEESYLEVQELEERNCSYCSKALTYNSCEVATESEIFCSDRCLKRLERTRGLTEQLSSLQKSRRAAGIKRSMHDPLESEDEINSKQIKLVVLSPQSSRMKQSSSPVQARRTEINNSSSTMVEIVNFTVEQDDSSSVPEQAPPSPKTPIRIVKKSSDNPVTSPKKTPTPVRTPRPPPAEQSTTKTKTAASDEGSCHSFAGGHVYPQEDVRSADHKLQWTKAVISRPAPQFEATAVVEGAFKKIKLSDYHGKYLVFFFYPLDFTFVCPTEILAFSDRVKEFKKLNTEVIAASIDSHFTHLAWINTPRKEGGLGKINIPLVSDITHSIAKDYGVYLDDLGHTLRGLFIIDDRGILRQITMNDLPVGRSVDETLRLVQAFQYTDKHGEVCPAGWKPGQDTIVPNPEEKMKYFEKNHKY